MLIPLTFWLVLFALVALSLLIPNKMPLRVAILLYLVKVVSEFVVKTKDYQEWEKLNYRDEKLKLQKYTDSMASKGFALHGHRPIGENKIREDFEFERRKAKRKLWIELVDTLFLK